jgi:3D (Asp-Asp-Asp) domain-containing protein
MSIVDYILTAALIFLNPGQTPPNLNQPIDPPDTIVVTSVQPVVTTSRFSQKTEEVTSVISKETNTINDPEMEVGEEKVIDEGTDGKTIKTYKVTYYLNEEYSRELISTNTTPQIPKQVAKGTKIVWRTLDTADGQIRYWRKIHVWATHYDSHCPGCNDWTAIGMRAGKGVIAVDPSVIKLRSNVYIPGYGKAVAGDTGGAIKGNIIDLGFEDARTAGWSARFVDIYLL